MPDRPKQILGIVLLIVGIGLCSYGLSQLLKPAQYAATARIKIEPEFINDGPDYSYNPYFIQTEFEILQSQLVLFNVITNLNLNEAWGKKYFSGATLKPAKTMEIIKSRMILTPIRNTKLIAITFFSEDPNEAAQVANAIAKAYCDYRAGTHRELTKKGHEILQQQFQDEEKQISILQTNVEQLRQKFEIQNIVSTNQSPEQQPYWDEKQKLDQLIKLHEVVHSKLEAEKLDLLIIKDSMVVIPDIAEPPKFPVSPNRFLGAALLVLGLFLTAAGLFLLKPSVQDGN